MAIEKLVLNENMIIGIEEIDYQHRKLVQMINDLIEANNLMIGSELISDVLSRMTEYADDHFTAEEQRMRERGYPYLEAHEREHADFMRKTAQLAVEVMDGRSTVPGEIIEYLKTWLVNHIMISDKKYAPYLKS